LLPMSVIMAIARPVDLHTRHVTSFPFNMKPRAQSPTRTRTTESRGGGTRIFHGHHRHHRLTTSSGMGAMIAAYNNLYHLSNNPRHLHLESGKSGWRRQE
jgi:hypothetical protein